MAEHFKQAMTLEDQLQLFCHKIVLCYQCVEQQDNYPPQSCRITPDFDFAGQFYC